jgi:hypothetical protein
MRYIVIARVFSVTPDGTDKAVGRFSDTLFLQQLWKVAQRFNHPRALTCWAFVTDREAKNNKQGETRCS